MIEVQQTLDAILARLTAIEQQLGSAFVAGDTDGHRRYHEAVIDALAERKKLRMAIQEKTISGLVWALIVGMVTAIWQYLKTEIHK